MKTRNIILSILFILTFVFGVPWYWDSLDKSITYGFPTWVTASIFSSFLLSCLTAYALRKPWDIEETEEEENNNIK
ncbi:MAG: hypothetical protein COA79_06115 [Planctomycetota bacterium]|nr:MAG: hypothetical protein COA79_06115 [Planctomycetota bacterium]